jgi:hypothetical protein
MAAVSDVGPFADRRLHTGESARIKIKMLQKGRYKRAYKYVGYDQEEPSIRIRRGASVC